MWNVVFVLVSLTATSLSVPVPADDPIKIDLPVYDQPQVASDVLIQPLEPENHGGVQARNDKTLIGSILTHKLHAATNVLGSKLAAASAHQHKPPPQETQAGVISSIFSPALTREDAVLETEGWGSKTLSVKDNLHHIVAGIFQPKPIVDTIDETEKYGNSGDKYYGVGRAVVGGAAGVSNLVNTVLEVPGNIFRKITRVATEKLNNIGGKLIGLN